MTVDEFVDSKVVPEHRGIVAQLRRLMREHAPNAREVISYGLPMYLQSRPMAWISPSKTGISFGFRQGTAFDDKYSLLKGAGKHAKRIRMRSMADVNITALRYYIKQAVKLDKRSRQRSPPASARGLASCQPCAPQSCRRTIPLPAWRFVSLNRSRNSRAGGSSR